MSYTRVWDTQTRQAEHHKTDLEQVKRDVPAHKCDPQLKNVVGGSRVKMYCLYAMLCVYYDVYMRGNVVVVLLRVALRCLSMLNRLEFH